MSKKDIFKSIVNRSISTIEIPKNITKIGDYAFAYCKGLTSLTIPQNITELGVSIVAYTSIKSLTIPSSVIDLNWGAFAYSNIKELTISNGVQSLSGSALGFSLDTLTIPASVSKIGNVFVNSLGSLSYKTITFLQPSGMAVEMGSGVFDCKTASTLTVYTDNEDIKNYNYAGDNVTATIYHLDGSAWA